MSTEKTNKEIIIFLTEYFMKQKQEHTCKMLACTILDLNSIINYQRLERNDRENLMYRVNWNLRQLHELIEKCPTNELKTVNTDSLEIMRKYRTYNVDELVLFDILRDIIYKFAPEKASEISYKDAQDFVEEWTDKNFKI